MSTQIKIKVVESVTCPRCGCKEVEDNTLPITEWRFNIRAYRVEHSGCWWSKCLRCQEAGREDCWFNDAGEFGK